MNKAKKRRKRMRRRLALLVVDPTTGLPKGVAVRRIDRRSVITIRPPFNAEFLFYLFTSPQNCDALVGDLEERYSLILNRFGVRRASLWYWTRAIQAAGPIVWAATKKLLKAVSGVAALVEMWRRIRA